MDIPILENMSFKMYSDKYISKHYPEFFEYLNNKYGSISIKEIIYLYFHQLDEPSRCKVSGKYTKLENFNIGYRKYCSSKCCNSDPDKIISTRNNIINKYGVENISQLETIKYKKKKTCLKNYGVENPSQSLEIQNKIKQTNIERYGVEYAQQCDIIKNKFETTMIERYGVTHPSQSDIVKNKKKETCLKNYGVESPSQSDIVKSRQKEAFNRKYMEIHPDIIEIFEDNGERIYKCKCSNNNCNKCIEKIFTIHSNLYHSRNYHQIEKCTIINPIDHKGKDTNIEKFIKNILDFHSIEYVTNVRLFDNLEVDIYIPSKKIAIECNGVYWHSDKIKTKNYHYKKYKVYEENNIQLLSIWED